MAVAGADLARLVGDPLMAPRWVLHRGDCIEALRDMPDSSVDSVVTDPPYGLSDHKPADVVACLAAWLAGEEYRPNKKGFMGRAWDSWVPGPEVWREVFRVLKPGGHIVAFAGSRTHDLMSMALRLAGFECRDTVIWIYAQGFPKSMDVSKAIDKAAGAEREVIGVKGKSGAARSCMAGDFAGGEYMATTSATDAARQWAGWGTALKPAFEPALLFRKPLVGTVADNVLKHGTGALNIQACRIEAERVTGCGGGGSRLYEGGLSREGCEARPTEGRFPANVIHDGSPEVLAHFPDSDGAGPSLPRVKVTGYGDGIGSGESAYLGGERIPFDAGSGSAARFFYCPKASTQDRDEGCQSLPRGNHHPTVKPTDLMRYLCRLVTPPGGVVLDPFTGSGSTGKAAILEGFSFIGCELLNDHADIAEARMQHALGTAAQDLFFGIHQAA